SSSTAGCRRTERSRPVGLLVSQSREMKKAGGVASLRLWGRDEADRHGRSARDWRVGRIVAAARDVEDRHVEASVGIHIVDKDLQEANNRHRGCARSVDGDGSIVIDRK